MSKAKIDVHFHYGNEDFEKIMGKIIWQKLFHSTFYEEDSSKICYSKGNRTTAIYQKDNKR